jgi:hypothetical protein
MLDISVRKCRHGALEPPAVPLAHTARPSRLSHHVRLGPQRLPPPPKTTGCTLTPLPRRYPARPAAAGAAETRAFDPRTWPEIRARVEAEHHPARAQ